jgi:hypothetical protein
MRRVGAFRLQLCVAFIALGAVVLAIGLVPTSKGDSAKGPPKLIDPSGEAMPVGDVTVRGQAWHQIYADNFPPREDVRLGASCGARNGFPHRLSNWSAYPYPWKGTPTWGTYCPRRTTSIHDGVMDIWLHSERVAGRMRHLIDAVIPKIAGHPVWNGQLYGRYVIRFRVPVSFPMFHISWLLWPDSNVWPRDGEIDFPEGDSDGLMWAYPHWPNASAGYQHNSYNTRMPFYGGWHTATIEWLPSRVTFLLDGMVVGNSTNPSKITDKPLHWVIQNNGSPLVSRPDTTSQGHINIDWVTIYSPA